MRLFTAALGAMLGLSACASSGGNDPALSVAWDPNEGVRYLLAEGCVPAVEQLMPVKEAIDRGQAMSRVRTLDGSPLNDEPGTPAYALISGASIVMTGHANRCRIASSSGEPEQLQQAALAAIKDGGWKLLPGAPEYMAPVEGMQVEVRCKSTPNGTLLLTLFKPLQADAAIRFQAVVSRAAAAHCSTP